MGDRPEYRFAINEREDSALKTSYNAMHSPAPRSMITDSRTFESSHLVFDAGGLGARGFPHADGPGGGGT